MAFSFLSLFHSKRALRVDACSPQPIQVPEQQRVHASQSVAHSWTVTGGVSEKHQSQLTKLRIDSPGLTIVRVRTDLSDGITNNNTNTTNANTTNANNTNTNNTNPATVLATVRVSSDTASRIDCLTVKPKKRDELRIAFKNKIPTDSDTPGALVIEVELHHASLLQSILVAGGGNVVVLNNVLARNVERSRLTLTCKDRSRLFVREMASTEELAVEELLVGCLSGGCVFFESSAAISARSKFACGVVGDGSLHIRAPRVETKDTSIGVMGLHGCVQIHAPDGFVVTNTLESMVQNGGALLIQSSPAWEIDQPVVCKLQKLDVVGDGRMDVGAIVSQRAKVSIQDAGRVTLQARETLKLDCHTHSNTVVECVGAEPTNVSGSSKHVTRTQTSHNERVQAALVASPEVPTIYDAFDKPRLVRAQKVGVLDTLAPMLEENNEEKKNLPSGAWLQVFSGDARDD